MIKKNKREVKKKNECLFLIANLVLSIFAIAFMIGWEAGIVKAQQDLLAGRELLGIGVGGGGPAQTPAPTPATTVVLTKNSVLTKDSVSLLGAGSKVTPAAGEFAGKEVVLGSQLAGGDGYSVASIAGKPASGQIASSDLIGGNVGELPTSAAGTKSGGFLSKMFSPTGGAMGLLKAAGWAMTTYMVVGWIGKALGASDELAKALVVKGGML